jgi:hypothetical protein
MWDARWMQPDVPLAEPIEESILFVDASGNLVPDDSPDAVQAEITSVYPGGEVEHTVLAIGPAPVTV